MGGLWAGTIYRVDGRDLNVKGIRIYEVKISWGGVWIPICRNTVAISIQLQS